MFVHLHNHFMIDSSMKLKDAVAKAVADNQPAMAITDHNTVALHIQFYNECIKNNIKPILGCEFYFVDDAANANNPENRAKAHLLVLAKNKTGLANLYKMISESKSEYYLREKVSLVDWNLLEKYKEGLIVTNACVYGTIASKIMRNEDYFSYAERFVEMLGDDFYFEIGYHYFPDQRYVNKKIIELAEKFNKTAILVNDCHFTEQEDWYIHDIIFIKSFQFKNSNISSESQESYFKTEKEMIELGYHQKHLDETVKLSQKIETISPLEIITDSKPTENFCLTSKIYSVNAVEAVQWSCGKFNIEQNKIDSVLKSVNTNKPLKIQYEQSDILKKFLDQNEMVKEAAFKLEGIQVNNFPEKQNIIFKTVTLPTASYIDKFEFSLLPYVDLVKHLKTDELSSKPEYKKAIDKAFIFGDALDYYNGDEFEYAINGFKKLENDDEYGYESKFYLANAYFFKNEYHKAIKYYEYLEGKILPDEKKYWVYYFYGICLDKYKRNRQKAIYMFEQSIEINNNKSNAFYAMGITLFFDRQYEKSLKTFEKFLKVAASKDANKIPRVNDFISKIKKKLT